MKPLVVIPARGGSKGIPGKNIRLLGGKPLIQYTIEAAREVFPDKVICVSTDDVKIKNIVEGLGLSVPFLRPSQLSTDNTPTYEVLLHAIRHYESNSYIPDTLILLQPTSPFRKSKHIIEALKLFNDECDMVVSVKETKSNPYYVLWEESEQGWLKKSKKGKFTRRQDCPRVWEYNGAIYIFASETLKQKTFQQLSKIRKFVMEDYASLDIDDELDLKIADCIMKHG